MGDVVLRMEYAWVIKNWRVVLCIKYAWPIKSFKTGPPYGLLCAHELMFSSQEVLCSFYSLRMHNSIPKSIRCLRTKQPKACAR